MYIFWRRRRRRRRQRRRRRRSRRRQQSRPSAKISAVGENLDRRRKSRSSAKISAKICWPLFMSSIEGHQNSNTSSGRRKLTPRSRSFREVSRSFRKLFDVFRPFLNVFGPVRMRSHAFECVWALSEIFRISHFFWTILMNFGRDWTWAVTFIDILRFQRLLFWVVTIWRPHYVRT